jgi:hypothetical protein
VNVDTGEFRRLTEHAADAERNRRIADALTEAAAAVGILHDQRVEQLVRTIADLAEGRPDLVSQAARSRRAQFRVIDGDEQ